MGEVFEEYKRQGKEKIKDRTQGDRIEILLWVIIEKMFMKDEFWRRMDGISSLVEVEFD